MKKIPVLMLAVLLAACGGKSDTAASQADAGLPPKPSFKVKFIDSTVTQGLPLGKASEDKTNDGKKRLSYAIEVWTRRMFWKSSATVPKIWK